MRPMLLATVLALIPVTALAEITNIAGHPDRYEEYYGEVRGWYVSINGSPGAPDAYCVAYRDDDLRIGYASGTWQLAVPSSEGPDWYGRLEIDGKLGGASGTAANGWAFAWLNIGELGALMKGNAAILDVGKVSYDFSLSGMTAAVLKVAECWQTQSGSLAPLP